MYSGLTMTTPKGGRGKKAPYKTQQMRVPVPIKDQVNILIAKFRNRILNGLEADTNITDLTLSPDLIIQDEIEDLKAALEESDQQIDNLNTTLENAQAEIKRLYSDLEQERQKEQRITIGSKIQQELSVNCTISEGEARKLFNISREVLRIPREKGQTKVSFEYNNKLIELEYIGQPEGKGTPHYWKIIKIEKSQSSLSLLS
jgi:hypothetical protein